MAPCLCSIRAMPPPMPPVAPVTSAVLSVSSNMTLLLGKRGQRGVDIMRRADRGCGERTRYPLGEAGQHLARADLVDGRYAVRGHAHDALAPAHRAGDLIDEPAPDLGWVADGRRQHVGDDRHRGRLDIDLG